MRGSRRMGRREEEYKKLRIMGRRKHKKED